MKYSEVINELYKLRQQAIENHNKLNYDKVLFAHDNDNYYLIYEKDLALVVQTDYGYIWKADFTPNWWLGINFWKIHEATEEEIKKVGKLYHQYVKEEVERRVACWEEDNF
jgi:hypothetical protein